MPLGCKNYVSPHGLEEALLQFNTIFTNNFVKNETEHRVSVIARGMNATAEYMAVYGMQNMTELVETPGVFGNLQHYLGRDMGLALPMVILPNYGQGEIEDMSPPQ